MAIPTVRPTADSLLVGESTTDKVGLHGAAVVQRASAAQAVVTQTGAVVGTNDASDLDSAETLVNALKVQGNAHRADIAALVALVNELRAALVAKGIIKGSA